MYTHEILIECGVSLHSHNDVAIFKNSVVETRRLRAGKPVGSGPHNDQSGNTEVGCKFSLGGGCNIATQLFVLLGVAMTFLRMQQHLYINIRTSTT